MKPSVVVLDYGSGNVRSAVRALERVGARVELTARRDQVLEADGLVVPGVGAFGACLAALQSVRGGELIGRRLAGSRPVLGICVGMQVLFERLDRAGDRSDQAPPGWGSGRASSSGWRRRSCRTWAGARCGRPAGTRLFRGVEHERFYFVHSYAVRRLGAGDAARLAARGAAGDLGRPRRAVRRRGRERPAVGDPVPPGEVRRRRRHPARELGVVAVTGQ